MNAASRRGPATLAVDIGGSGLKACVLDAAGHMRGERVRVPTPASPAPDALVDTLVQLVEGLPAFDRLSIGFPGVVRDGAVLTAPHFGTADWRGFPLAERLAQRLGGVPARLLNDAEVQGFGVIAGRGLELVLTLGTGLGSALFRDGALMPHMEFAQFPAFGKKTMNRYVGDKARRKVGRKRWNRRVRRTMDAFRTLVGFDRLYLGGGNARKLDFALPPDVLIVSNKAGLTGGIRLWDAPAANR